MLKDEPEFHPEFVQAVEEIILSKSNNNIDSWRMLSDVFGEGVVNEIERYHQFKQYLWNAQVRQYWSCNLDAGGNIKVTPIMSDLSNFQPE